MTQKPLTQKPLTQDPLTPSLLQQELASQPDVAAAFVDRTRPRLDELRSALRAGEIDGLVLAARGSSDNAARYAQYLWGLRLGLPVTLATPSLHTVYGRTLDVRRHAVVAISQSGTSPDVVSMLDEARAQGSPTLAITNDGSSPLARAADTVVDLAAGPELSVAATKTYTASLLAVALLAVAMGDPSERSDALHALEQVPGALSAAITETSGVAAAAALLDAGDRAVTVGRGLNLSTAYETALKITELTGVLVAPYSPADLLHGPVAAVGPEVPAVLIAPQEPASSSVLEIVAELRRRGTPIMIVCPTDQPPADEGVGRLGLPPRARLEDWLTPLVAVVPGQLVAHALAERRGVDVDRPGGLSKVTLTT